MSRLFTSAALKSQNVDSFWIRYSSLIGFLMTFSSFYKMSHPVINEHIYFDVVLLIVVTPTHLKVTVQNLFFSLLRCVQLLERGQWVGQDANRWTIDVIISKIWDMEACGRTTW